MVGVVDPGTVTETWPTELTVMDCALDGMVMPGCTTLPAGVTMRPCESIENDPSRV